MISHESIYRFIYAQLARVKDYSWRQFLPRAKSKRGWRGSKGGSPARLIAFRRPLSERPKEADDRKTPGHWEGDLMLFGVHKKPVLALVERHSRLLVATRPNSKHADPMARMMAKILAPFPPSWRRTVTFDNGTEFARHHWLHALGIQTFFCDTHSPWQKGSVENAIGRMRRWLPRKTDLAAVSDERFTQLVRAYNNTPRKCLGYLTPAEVFHNQVLHFKRELSFPPARERRGRHHPDPSRRSSLYQDDMVADGLGRRPVRLAGVAHLRRLQRARARERVPTRPALRGTPAPHPRPQPSRRA